jgi:general secretion pathway protein H
MPTHWIETGTSAQVIGARAVVLGPEPLIGAQRIVLHLGDHRLTLATDGIGPFAVAQDNAPS